MSNDRHHHVNDAGHQAQGRSAIRPQLVEIFAFAETFRVSLVDEIDFGTR
jgi:hypothetical protein